MPIFYLIDAKIQWKSNKLITTLKTKNLVGRFYELPNYICKKQINEIGLITYTLNL
jgi:hypothetical protein